MIRVLIVDDHPLFRGGLVALLRTVPDIDIVDAVGVGQRAVRSAVELAPDIIVMDLNLPASPGWRPSGASWRMTPVRASWCSRWSTTTMR
jgi:DNA-binding NarL/FixJ family response regulator